MDEMSARVGVVLVDIVGCNGRPSHVLREYVLVGTRGDSSIQMVVLLFHAPMGTPNKFALAVIGGTLSMGEL